MAIRTILIPTWAHADPLPLLDAGLALAERIGAHLQVMFVQLDTRAVLMTMPELVSSGVDFTRIEQESEASVAAARAQFDAWCGRRGVPAAPADGHERRASASWTERVGDFSVLVEETGRLSDFIIIGNTDAQELLGGRAFQPAVFGTGRPALVLTEPAPALLEHVMIAWNGSLEASNAVAQSTDLLRIASRLSIYPEGVGEREVEALAGFLRRHDIPAAGEVAPVAASSTGASILASAEAAGVTLLLRGAYTQSRLKQAILGGTTHHLLRYARIPIVMAH